MKKQFSRMPFFLLPTRPVPGPRPPSHTSGRYGRLISPQMGRNFIETWRHEQSEIWETHHKHIFMGAGKYDNKHGVGIMLNKRWRERIIRHRVHQRACHQDHDPGQPLTHQVDECVLSPLNMLTTILRRCTKQSTTTWCTVIDTFLSLEETSMLSWGLEKERNVKVWADTLSTRVIKEEIG